MSDEPISRLISFANNTLKIETKDAQVNNLIGRLYRHIPAHNQNPHTTYRLWQTNSSKFYQLYRDDTLIHESDIIGTVAEFLLGDSSYHLAAHSREGLLFHAAALAWEGQGVLLPGASGTGKSTLTAWLLTQKFDYLTDELTFIDCGDDRLQGFTRPLNLKRPSRQALKAYCDYAAHPHQIVTSPAVDLIPHTLFNPTSQFSRPPLCLILLPRYQSNKTFELLPLSKAQAGLALMQTLINARNLPEHGFPEITRLARLVPAYELHYSHFDQVETQIDKLLKG